MLHPVAVRLVQESSSDFTLQVSLILTTQFSNILNEIKPVQYLYCHYSQHGCFSYFQISIWVNILKFKTYTTAEEVLHILEDVYGCYEYEIVIAKLL